MSFDPARLAADFPILASGHSTYLDTAASSLTPTVVVDAMNAYYQEYRANIHRGLYDWSVQASEKYEEAHADVARFLNASGPDEIVFTAGTTSAINMIATMLTAPLQVGDEIVVSLLEHHSNFVPWQQAAKRLGLTFVTVGVTPEGFIDVADAKMKLNVHTKVFAFSAASNTLGTVQPVAELAALAHAHGAVVVVDGAQHMPHVRADMQALGCDFYAFSGHKLYGPTGTGGFYGKREQLLKIEPAAFGGDMISEVTVETSTWNELPWKFEAGTPNIAGGIGLGAAVRYLEGIGMDAVAEHDRALTACAIPKLKAVPGLRLIGPDDAERRMGALSFTLEGLHPHDAAELLNRSQIAIRAGHHCTMPLNAAFGLPNGTVRASFGVYSTEQDIDRLVEGLQAARTIFPL